MRYALAFFLAASVAVADPVPEAALAPPVTREAVIEGSVLFGLGACVGVVLTLIATATPHKG